MSKTLVKVVIGVVVIGGGLAYMVVNAMQSSWSYYISVDEFPAKYKLAQTNTLRWEDYTQTAVDPDDDCTIWYVGTISGREPRPTLPGSEPFDFQGALRRSYLWAGPEMGGPRSRFPHRLTSAQSTPERDRKTVIPVATQPAP